MTSRQRIGLLIARAIKEGADELHQLAADVAKDDPEISMMLRKTADDFWATSKPYENMK